MADGDTLPVGGSANPYDFLSLIAALSANQKNPPQSGFNRLFMPELGALTGTYYQQPKQGGTNDEYLMMQHAPDIARASQLDPADIRARIVGDIVDRGMNLWDVQNRVEQYAAEAARSNPTYAQTANSKDLKDYAAKIQSQWDSLRAASMKGDSGGSGGADDFFSKAGLPSPDLQYAPEQLAPEFFNKYAQDKAARENELAMLARQTASRQQAQKKLDALSAEKDYASSSEGKRKLKGIEGLRYSYSKVNPYDLPRKNYYRKAIAKAEREFAQAGGGEPYAAENVRFADIAKRIVASRGDDVPYQVKRDEIVARQKYDDEVAQLVMEGLSRRAAEQGYTPFMNAMLKRAQMLGMGRTD